ncbi:histidine phosphatase family protein [Nocardia miyunensis]|uniref:histidine phosphatase family protein n=1 Tax=Nocardia miyunensis TaxID=282684 RepID=UPI000AB82113|nr:histidine phosphatase family protein [Nocardia miyunensis]
MRHSDDVQLVLVRHAQPERLVTADGPADPDLTEIGGAQAARVPDALARLEAGGHRIARIVSSPQRRARSTAAPSAAKFGLPVDIFDGLAEYDRELPVYLPIEDARRAAEGSDSAQAEFAAVYRRIKAGYLPEQIDGAAFFARVSGAIEEIVAAADHSETVVAFAHGGVINMLAQQILNLERPLTFPIDYCSITRILYSRTGNRTVATINENGHVWDLLPRNLPGR